MKRAVLYTGKIFEYLFLMVIFTPFVLLPLILAVAFSAYVLGMLGLVLIVVLIMAALLAAMTTWPFWICAASTGFFGLAVLMMQAVTIGDGGRDCSQYSQNCIVNPLLALVAGLYLGGMWFGDREC